MADGSVGKIVVPITAAEIADEMWLEVARNPVMAAPMRQAEERVRLFASTGPAPPPLPKHLPLPALLALDGDSFISAAYATLLGRPADQAGRAYLAGQLARGRSKVEVLGELQASAEAKQGGRRLAGLRPRYLARRAYRLPLIGPFVRAAAAVARHLGLSRWLAGEGRTGRLQQQAVIAQLDGLEASRRNLERRAAEQDRQLQVLSDCNASLTRQLTVTEDSLSKALSATANSVSGHESRMAKLEQVVDVDALSARIDEVAGCLRSDLDSRVIAAEAIAEQSRRDIADQQRRIGLMLNALNAVKALGHGVPASVEAEDDHALDALYVAFEDRFRGTRATIKQRQGIYLPRLRDAGAGTADRPVLDIGAGRGEFLELLREEGLQSFGVDSNQTMVSVCHDAGLDCVQGDALACLAARADRSLGAITGFHIIEHLPFKVTVRIIDEALRVLVPGGLLILETPNPANILTASRWFYLDPTHRNPLPGEMVAMIAEARGFPYPEILELHPMAARFPGADRQLTGALDQIFYGPQDYALIACKP